MYVHTETFILGWPYTSRISTLWPAVPINFQQDAYSLPVFEGRYRVFIMCGKIAFIYLYSFFFFFKSIPPFLGEISYE